MGKEEAPHIPEQQSGPRDPDLELQNPKGKEQGMRQRLFPSHFMSYKPPFPPLAARFIFDGSSQK